MVATHAAHPRLPALALGVLHEVGQSTRMLWTGADHARTAPLVYPRELAGACVPLLRAAEPMVRAALAFLVGGVEESRGFSAGFLQGGGPAAVRAAMAAHPRSGRLHMHGCLLLKKMCGMAQIELKLLAIAGVDEDAIPAMEVLAAPGTAAAALAAITGFPHDTGVLEPAVSLAGIIAKEDKMRATSLVLQGAVEATVVAVAGVVAARMRQRIVVDCFGLLESLLTLAQPEGPARARAANAKATLEAAQPILVLHGEGELGTRVLALVAAE